MHKWQRYQKFIVIIALLALCGWGGVRLKKKLSPKEYSTIHIDRDIFVERVQRGVPEWMKAQIAQDLAPFAAGITEKMLDQAFNESFKKKYQLIRFKVKNGVISYESSPEMDQSKIFIQTKTALKVLNDAKPLPNLDFIIAFTDNLEDLPAEYLGPLFIYAKLKSEKRLILLPDFKALAGYDNVRHEIAQGVTSFPWEQKKDVVFWRGSTTGGHYDFSNWMNYPRSKLVLLSKEHPGEIDARFTAISQCDSALKPFMKKKGFGAKYMKKAGHLAYKYLIDVDGNTSTYERCYWELLSNCVTFKHDSPYIQWYYGALKPYVHYIPVEREMGDLLEKITWARAHDEECRRIAKASTEFVENNLMPEDVLLYVNEALNAYAKLQKF